MNGRVAALGPLLETGSLDERCQWLAQIPEAEWLSLLAHPVFHRLLDSVAQAPATGEPYGRRVLDPHGAGEVMLASWSSNQRCAPHDHGGTRGSVLLVEGKFTETQWRFHAGVLQPIRSIEYSAPKWIEVVPETIHDMQAHHGGTTFHRYVGKPAHMRVFDVPRRETLWVTEDCGAWIPSEPSRVVRRTAWEHGL